MYRLVDDFVLVSLDETDGLRKQTKTDEPEFLGDISEYIDSIADALWPVNKRIHDNPELGFKEFIAHEALTKFMKTRDGWKVFPSVYGMATAWIAVYDSGKKGPVISFNVEMGECFHDVCNP